MAGSDLRPLSEMVERVGLMDCLNLLGANLGRARSGIEDIADAPVNENTKRTLLRLQTILDNYYHFLARLGLEQEQCSAQLVWARSSAHDDPRVARPKREIANEFGRSRDKFIGHIKDLEGASLLSWVHTIRYQIVRTQRKAEDLQRWAEALTRLSESREVLKDLNLMVGDGWPELTSQAQAAYERLGREMERPWSYGSGRRVSRLSEQLESSLGALKALADEMSELRALGVALSEQLRDETGDDIGALLREIERAGSPLHPRLRRLLREGAEIRRRLKVGGQLESVAVRERASLFAPTDYADWVEHLSKAHEKVGKLHLLARPLMKVLPNVSSLLKRLKNEEQRQELLSRRESLVRILLEMNLVHGEASYSALIHMNWLAIRLTAERSGRRLCTRFGEVILPDDATAECPSCGESCHRVCLLKGKCPVCGELIIPDDEPSEDFR